MNDSQKILSRIETIWPKRAEALLGTSEGNRNLKVKKIESYTRDMLAGNWQVNGEPIIIDENGNLVDGHHRLTAVIKSDISISSLVVSGVSKDSKFTIDMGASRSVADALSFAGVVQGNLVSSIARNLMSLESRTARSANPSSQELLAYVEENPEIKEAATFASSKMLPRCGTLMGSAYVVDPLSAIDFGEVLKTGIPHYAGCPAHKFREMVTKSTMGFSPKISLTDLQLLFVAAFEKFRNGERVKRLVKAKEYRLKGW